MKAREIDIFLNVYKFWGYAVRDKGAEKAIVKFKEIDEYLVMHNIPTMLRPGDTKAFEILMRIRWHLEFPRIRSMDFVMQIYSEL